MKKKVLSVLCLLLCICCFVGCRTREDLIPKELGAPEGLWLYRGAERMRTDGSEREKLFTDIELDGEAYSEEDYTVGDYCYCTDTKTAFFTLHAGEGHYLYVYDYAEKTGKQMGRVEEWCTVYASEYYICFVGKNVKSLYSRDGVLLCEGMEGFEFTQDILYKYERSGEEDLLVWWKDGMLHSVPIAHWEGGSQHFYDGKLIYHFTDDGGIAIDTDTEEVFPIPYEGEFDECEGHDGVLWFLTRETRRYTEGSMSYSTNYSRFYRFTPSESSRFIDAFEGNGASLVSATDEEVCICLYDTKWYTSYWYYNIASGELTQGERQWPETDNSLTCGEYTFWWGYEPYGFMTGGKCYYLYRRHGDIVEIMQYAFEDEFHWSDRFFDDICEE